jgi:hypothetical protein
LESVDISTRSEMRKTNEFKRFSELTDKLIAVPHSEIKAKLDAEKQAKKSAKRKRKGD